MTEVKEANALQQWAPEGLPWGWQVLSIDVVYDTSGWYRDRWTKRVPPNSFHTLEIRLVHLASGVEVHLDCPTREHLHYQIKFLEAVTPHLMGVYGLELRTNSAYR